MGTVTPITDRGRVMDSVRKHCRALQLTTEQTQTCIAAAIALLRGNASLAYAIGVGKQTAERMARPAMRRNGPHDPRPAA